MPPWHLPRFFSRVATVYNYKSLRDNKRNEFSSPCCMLLWLIMSKYPANKDKTRSQSAGISLALSESRSPAWKRRSHASNVIATSECIVMCLEASLSGAVSHRGRFFDGSLMEFSQRFLHRSCLYYSSFQFLFCLVKMCRYLA